jgi:hypothetical protein
MADSGSEQSKKWSFNILSALGLVVGLAVGITLSQWDTPEDKPLVHAPPGGTPVQEPFDEFAGKPAEASQIRDVQKLLAAKGYDPGAVDGQMSAATVRAIQQYQRDQGKRQTGQISKNLMADLEDAEEKAAIADDAVSPRGIGVDRKKVRSHFDDPSKGYNFDWQEPVQGHVRVRGVSADKRSVIDLIGPEDDLASTQLSMPLPDENDQKEIQRSVENLTAYLQVTAPKAVKWGRENVRTAVKRGRVAKNFDTKRVEMKTDTDAQLFQTKVEPIPLAVQWAELENNEKKPALPLKSSVVSAARMSAADVTGPLPAKPGSIIVIDTSGGDVRLCPNLQCVPEADILWMTSAQSLEVLAVAAVATDGAIAWDLVMYQVAVEGGATGWVSEYDTDQAPPRPRFR